MRVFIMGGTGFIGAAILCELIGRGHEVLALVRSDRSAAAARRFGASVLHGDIRSPGAWVPGMPPTDAVMHAACDFDDAMAETDRLLLDSLLPHLSSQPNKPRFLYTGGNWLFGATGGTVATEETNFAPLPAFAWMVQHSQRVLECDAVEGIVVHPAMVYADADGVFRRLAREAVERAAIRVVGGESVRWPLVHRDDLAELYALALKQAPAGSSYIGAAIEGLPVGRIARAFARRFRTKNAEPEIISNDVIAEELGEWARGYAMDQRMSGAKAQRELGWRPKHTDPEDEIARLAPIAPAS
ncbi:MAG TPA: NAD-dependent epimerase/dehydratase family protein [Stellaceae bacterium]|nr:NAD-dependent epimerase/dehydratase family protein [Stellaceae bacterium]